MKTDLVPMVSVVVPAFNAARWIAESLSSVVAQSYSRESMEIVVVDDGSTDETAAVAAQVLGRSGTTHAIIRHPSAAGPSAARNRGWRSAHGQWVQFLDADDLLDPSKISTQAKVAGAAASDVAALYSPWGRLVLRDGCWETVSPSVQPDVGVDPLLDLLHADNFMQLGCLLFSRQWLERVNGFDQSCVFIEDVDLLLRLTMAGGVLQRVASTEPLSWYRQHATSLSKSDDRRFVEGCVRNARLVEHYWRDGDALTATRASALAGIYFIGARFFSGCDTGTFDALVRDIYRLSPNFVPDAPRPLRFLARLFGYPRAERCAVQYRRFKRTIRPQAGA